MGQSQVQLLCGSVYDEDLKKKIDSVQRHSKLFNAVYFSGSFALMPDMLGALKASSLLLKKNGLIYITQTYQKRYTPLLATFKPLLKYFTTIDFGKLTYQTDLEALLKRSEMKILRNDVIPGSVDNFWQSARIIVLDPQK